MSHTAKINTKFSDINLDSFRRALVNLGWKVVANAKARTYPSDPARDTVYPWVAVNPLPHGYDVGITISDSTREIEVNYDTFGGTVEQGLGAGLSRLKTEYNCCVIEDVMAFQGYTATRELQENGSVLVRCLG